MTATAYDLESAADDALAGAVSCDSSINGLWAEKLRYVHDFVVDLAGDEAVVRLAGRQQMVRFGGAGTPAVPEFAVCQLQVELGLSPYAAQLLVADALTLVHRLPRVFDALAAGYVDVWRVQMVASATRHLSLEASARVQDAVLAGADPAQPVLRRLTRARLNLVIERAVAAEEEDAATLEEQVAGALTSRDVTVRPGERGTMDLFGSLSTGDGLRLRQRLNQIAAWLAELGDTRSVAELRSVALGMLADHGTVDALWARVHRHRTRQLGLDDEPDEESRAAPDTAPAPMPQTVVYAHLDRDKDTWTVEDGGPLTPQEAAELVGHSQVVVRPVLDLAAELTYGGYAAPPLLRSQLALLNAGQCTFPWCERPARTGDYDHIDEWPRGPTSTRNGHLPCRRHHRVKTHAGWSVLTPSLGVWIWTDPRGHLYCVTNGATTQLN